MNALILQNQKLIKIYSSENLDICGVLFLENFFWSGNFVAVGTMSPHIDIWDVDVVDCIEPAFQLGHKKKRKSSRKKEKKGGMAGHTDSVLDLSWNRQAR